MSDASDLQFPELYARAEKHLDGIEDPILLILKGHLIVEETLYASIEAKCANPAHLENARLTFFQKLQIVRALYGRAADERKRESEDAVWDSAEALNTLRNRLAHHLEPKDVAPLLKRLHILKDPETLSLSDHRVIGDLNFPLAMLIGFVGGICDRARADATAGPSQPEQAEHRKQTNRRAEGTRQTG